MRFDDAVALSREAYTLGLAGWYPKFVERARTSRNEPVYENEPWERGQWASYRLGQRDRERSLALIRNPTLDTRRAPM